jgi:hypothetical protein
MRETRLSGSEGGAGQLNAPSLPLSPDRFLVSGREDVVMRLDVAGARRPGRRDGTPYHGAMGPLPSQEWLPPKALRAARPGRRAPATPSRSITPS